MSLLSAIQFIEAFKAENPRANKAEVEAAFVAQFRPQKERSVYVCAEYAVRFSHAHANEGQLPNSVSSLSRLQNLDAVPFVVCIVRPNRVDFLLANATFLKKISHSSTALRVDNVRGTFNGSNIMLDYEGIANRPENFDQLLAIHSSFTWQENLERLVEATNSIVARQVRYQPTAAERGVILDAPTRASLIQDSRPFQELAVELTATVARQHDHILNAAVSENVNLRGNLIEQLITGASGAHELGDLLRELEGGVHLAVDIKTKLLDRASAPKAYNVDKVLALLGQPNRNFMFLFVGIDVNARSVYGRLVSIFDPVVLDATRIQPHWAGRGSRGVTQLTGNIAVLFDPLYPARVDVGRGREHLERLLAL